MRPPSLVSQPVVAAGTGKNDNATAANVAAAASVMRKLEKFIVMEQWFTG
jgi:hypothetical protein